jgi:acyl-CoA synthetase (AMP-forming)/AMP-acid ligase II
LRVIDLFDRAASLYPDRQFLVQGAVGRLYRESHEASRLIASALHSRGFGVGSRAAFWSPNDWRLVEVIYGIFRAGAVMVPLNARNAINDNLNLLQDSGAELLFIHSRYAEHARQIRATCPKLRKIVCLDGSADGVESLESWLAGSDGSFTQFLHRPEDPWAIFGTSGTTGRSKCVVHTHLSAASAMIDMLYSMGTHAPVRHLVVAPLSHFAGIFFFALTAVGSTHLIADSTGPADIIETIVSQDVEIVFLPPTLVYLLLGEPGALRIRSSKLKSMILGGAPVAPEKMRRAIEAFGPVMCNFLGQTEAIGPITALVPADYMLGTRIAHEARLGSIGRPSIMRQVEIMGPDGALLKAGETGEIVLRGWGLTAGYVQADGTSLRDASLFAHGWLHTGDVGWKDPDGYITLVDRIKDMIISGGFNIYPVEVEQALLAHPSVMEVAVVGVPDEKWGEAVKAVVELESNAVADAAELIAFCKARVGSMKAPKSIEFWEKLPRNATGKVMKRLVREHFWQGRERRV